MKRLLALIAFVPAHALGFEFNVKVVWQHQGGWLPEFVGRKIDEQGRIVGTYRSIGGDSRTSRAARWTVGRIETFDGPNGRSYADATSRRGWIAGAAYLPDSDRVIAGYWGQDRMFRDLGIGPNSTVRAISDRGAILGEHTWRLPRSFVWKDGQRTDIPVFDERNESIPHDMNDAEVAVGIEALPEGGGTRPWMWDAVNGLRSIPITPYKINQAGAVAGARYRDPRNYAAIYKNGQVKLLEGGEVAWSLNDSGWIVGSSISWRGMLWREDGTASFLSDLIDPALGLDILRALDVNDSGQILAWAQKPGEYYGYTVRLDPVPRPWPRRSGAPKKKEQALHG